MCLPTARWARGAVPEPRTPCCAGSLGVAGATWTGTALERSVWATVLNLTQEGSGCVVSVHEDLTRVYSLVSGLGPTRVCEPSLPNCWDWLLLPYVPQLLGGGAGGEGLRPLAPQAGLQGCAHRPVAARLLRGRHRDP